MATLQVQLAAFEQGRQLTEPAEGNLEGESAEVALAQWGHLMSEHEKQEVLSVQRVHFVGGSARKVSKESWHDRDGHYNLVANDHLGFQYKVLGLMGTGAFSQAIQCIDCAAPLGGPHRVVVVKLVRADTQCDKQTDLEREACLLVRQHDPDGKMPIVQLLGEFRYVRPTSSVL